MSSHLTEKLSFPFNPLMFDSIKEWVFCQYRLGADPTQIFAQLISIVCWKV